MRRDILYKFFEGKASPKEQRLIGQWLDESEKHKEVLVRERMVFDAMIVSGGITDRQSVQSRKKRTRVVFMELLSRCGCNISNVLSRRIYLCTENGGNTLGE